MITYLGDFPVGSTIYIPFATFDKDDGSSITMSGFAVTDIEVYKNGNTTQRASDEGVSLLDTDGIDFDSITGIHGFSINTSNNTDTGFFVGGADYWVVVSTITVDSVSVSFIAAIFSLENRRTAGELIRTTISSLTNQTSFVLTAGSGDDDAYNNCTMIISDQASAVQKAVVRISDYVGSTRTVSLASAPCFTIAEGDTVTIIATSALANVALITGSNPTDQINTACDTALSDVGVTSERLARLDAAISSRWISGFRKGVAVNNFTFVLVLASNPYQKATGITPTVQIRRDNETVYTASSNAASEIVTYEFNINLTASEMNGDLITLKINGTNCLERIITIKTSS